MSRIAYFDCFSGVSGDMTLAALVSAGWPAEALTGLPGRLHLPDVDIEVRTVRRGAFAARQVEVRPAAQKAHRHLHHIEAILAAADLPVGVTERARAVFRRLAEAEAQVHGTTVQKVHFHEVGAVDAIVDIAGALLGLVDLGIEQVYASTLPLGGGTVMSEHGRIPVPAPATVQLLKGVPVRLGPVEAELVTPTGAALLAELVADWSGPPDYRLLASGIGAGSRDFPEHANVLRLLIGEASGSGPARREVAVLETSLDDATPQVLADLNSRLLAAGALDAMLAPVIMKKGRPGNLLVVISEVHDAERLAQLVQQHSPTLGVRARIETRLELPRKLVRVGTTLGEVELKVATLPDGSERAQPEFESVRALSMLTGRPIGEIAELAVAAWRADRPGDGAENASAVPSPSKKTD
ncbi:MAG: nickel pincer cofactor biosynthesis protein LarC [Candidatus Eisenbacteria bacterium]|nr:nickel pincer cofactor biosynthesis protein LarC [Candidatus Eisenbacteria bacterium]